jgi:hypothetical protein
MKINIQFDLDELDIKGATFASNKSAEYAIQKLREAEAMVTTSMKLLKLKLKENMDQEGFRSIKGDLVNVTMRESGARFIVTDIDSVPKEVIDVEYKLNPDKTEAYLEAHGNLPPGVEESSDRPISIVFKDAKTSSRG